LHSAPVTNPHLHGANRPRCSHQPLKLKVSPPARNNPRPRAPITDTDTARFRKKITISTKKFADFRRSRVYQYRGHAMQDYDRIMKETLKDAIDTLMSAPI
jgi:hypothetical protein